MKMLFCACILTYNLFSGSYKFFPSITVSLPLGHIVYVLPIDGLPTVPTVSSRTKGVVSPGIIHNRTTDCHRFLGMDDLTTECSLIHQLR